MNSEIHRPGNGIPSAGASALLVAGWRASSRLSRRLQAFGKTFWRNIESKRSGEPATRKSRIALPPSKHELTRQPKRRVSGFTQDFQDIFGPLVTMAVIVGLVGAVWHDINLLYLPVVLLLAVAFSTYVGGFRQGFTSAGLAWVYLSFFLFASSLSPTARLGNWLVWTAVLPSVVGITGFLHRRACEREFQPWKGNVEPFRMVSETVLDFAVALLDRQGKVTSWNTGAASIFGWTAAEMSGQTLDRCCHAEELDKGAPATVLNNAAAKGRHVGEWWCLRKNGKRFRAKVAVTPVRDEQNQVAGYTISIQDLSERQEAASALLRRAHQQVAVAALSQTALVTTEQHVLLDHAVTFVMQTWDVDFCAIFELQADGETLLMRAGAGWSDDCVGRLTIRAKPGSMMDYALKADEPVIVKDLSRIRHFEVPEFLRTHGITSGITLVIPGPNGATGLMSVHSRLPCEFVADDLGFFQAIASVLATARVRNQAEAENKKLAAFPQLNPNPVFELSSQGQLTYCNQAAKSMAAALHQSHPSELLPPDTADLVEDCLSTGATRLGLETQHAGRTIAWSFHPVPAIGRVHLYAVDITERLNLEAQLRQAQKMEAIGQLASGVAHDFNNILTIMQGYATRLLARTPRDDQREEMEQVLNATERAAGLTRQLLAFSRRQNLQPRLLDLREVVATMSRMLERLIGEHIALQVKKPSALPAVSADAGMMEQILLNLAVNARDAMSEGGELRLEMSVVEVDEAHVQKQPRARLGSFVCLKVADTGCGMSPETMARIFEPFFTTKDPGKGTGLGLATVYGIVEQHQGWIEVESELGRGTTFSILLPAAGEEIQPARPEADSTDVARGGHETILVVEDEALLRDLARAILQDLGYTILEASTGLEALVVWRQHRDEIDLLLTDMVMPGGLTGRELAERLRSERPNLKVVFSSGYSAEIAGMDAVVGQGSGFLQKPYRPPALAQVVRECLDGAGAEEEGEDLG